MNFYQIGAQCYRGWLTASLEPSNGQEAIVVGHAGGTGRVAGMCGALLCETPDKRRFKASFTSKTVSIWCCLRPYKFPQSWNDTRCCTLKKIYLNWLSVYRVKDFDESWIWHSDSVAIGTWRWALVWVMLKGGGIFTIQRPHCLDDTARRDPPVVNAVITYRYQELTADNIPRFPTLVGWDLWTQIAMHQTAFYKQFYMRCRWKDRHDLEPDLRDICDHLSIKTVSTKGWVWTFEFIRFQISFSEFCKSHFKARDAHNFSMATSLYIRRKFK